MKTPLLATSVSLLNGPVGNPRPGALRDSVMVVTEVQDKDLLHLPPVHVPRKPSCSVRRTSSARFQFPVKPDYVLQIKDSAFRTRSRSLVDIHEESVDTHDESVDTHEESADSDTSSSTITTSSNTQNGHLDEAKHNSLNQTEKAALTKTSKSHQNQTENATLSETLKAHTPSAPTTHAKLLASRKDQEKQSFGRSSPNHRHTRLYHIDSSNIVANKHPFCHKSYSQRDISVVEPDSSLPDITTGTRHSSELRNRSLSVTSFLPKLLPSIGITRAKSISQPDIFVHSELGGAPRAFCSPRLSRKLRVQQLWRRAGQKLGLPHEGSEPNSLSWVQGPGGSWRPVYSRWSQRRNALAEPERMIMTQQMREQILKEVDIRKRSMKRRMSQFLTVKLGLNMEEDLAA